MCVAERSRIHCAATPAPGLTKRVGLSIQPPGGPIAREFNVGGVWSLRIKSLAVCFRELAYLHGAFRRKRRVLSGIRRIDFFIEFLFYYERR
jgi:hypothetical protein